MALVTCPDCRKQVSSQAAACIHCGAPLGGLAPSSAPAADAASVGLPFKLGLWAISILVVLASLTTCGKSADPDSQRRATAREDASFQESKKRCAAAIASSMGHSTVGYSDKLAYEARVRDACAGISVDGKDLGQFGR
jgi:hypothetical protein